ARPLDALEPGGGDDLVGVDVGPVEGDGPAGDLAYGFHERSPRSYWSAGPRSDGAVKRPATAVAAATPGETRWVRPPGPWRPSKLRLDVEADRSPGESVSGFMPRHIEQPASRHSNPAAVNTPSRPSASAAALTCIEPGTTSARTPAATWRPRRTSAAARRSSRRPLVHEPRNTVSTGMSRMAVPAVRPMYCRALAAASRAAGSAKESGSGTASSSPTTCPGLVPQLT